MKPTSAQERRDSSLSVHPLEKDAAGGEPTTHGEHASPGNGRSGNGRPTWETLSAVSFPVTGAGDNPSIHRLLVNVFHGPSTAEFHAQQEEPRYEPSDRLMVRWNDQVVSHVLLTKHEMRFGRLRVPFAGVRDLATLPEFRGRGLASRLLQLADLQMVADGAIMGSLYTSEIAFFRRRGWAVCPRHCYSVAGPRDILSYLNAQSIEPPTQLHNQKPQRYNIRLWRAVEQAALSRLYENSAQESLGPLYRDEAYWRWLLGRRGYDRIYVAINGPDKFELDESLAPIVGYAVTKKNAIVELMTSPEHPEAANQLLARACGDAIEGDYHPVRIDAPPQSSLHQLVAAAGGQFHYHEADNGAAHMVKLFDPLGFVGLLGGEISRRARAAQLDLPCDLGLVFNGEKYQLTVTRRGARLKPGKLGRSYLTCNRAALTQLVLGHLSVNDAVEQGRLESSTRVGIDLASILFPRLPMWRPPFDDLPAD